MLATAGNVHCRVQASRAAVPDPERCAEIMKINISVKLDPKTGEYEDPASPIHDGMASWIADALSELRDPNTGQMVEYSIISAGSDSTPRVRVVDPAFQTQAESLIQAKLKRESPFQ